MAGGYGAGTISLSLGTERKWWGYKWFNDGPFQRQTASHHRNTISLHLIEKHWLSSAFCF